MEPERYPVEQERTARRGRRLNTWRQRNPTYNRDWMRRYRAYKREEAGAVLADVVGSLHDFACTGPTRRTGCRCQKIRVIAERSPESDR